MARTPQMLASFVAYELRNIANGAPNTESIRFLPRGSHQYLQRVLGIHNLCHDMEIPLPSGFRESSANFLTNIHGFFSGQKSYRRDSFRLADQLFLLFEPWNPLPSRGPDHKMRRAATALQYMLAQGFYYKKVSGLPNDASVESQSSVVNTESFWKFVKDDHSHQLMQFAILIAKAHAHMTVMELVWSTHLTGDLSKIRDLKIFDFLQTYPWYTSGSMGAAFLETLRAQTFAEDRKKSTNNEKTRHERSIMLAIAMSELDLPPGIRERSHARLPLDFRTFDFLLHLLISGGLWEKTFTERLERLLKLKGEALSHQEFESLLKQFVMIRANHGARLKALLNIDPSLASPQSQFEIFKIVVDLGGHHPLSYLGIRKAVFRCTLPMFADYSNLRKGCLRLAPQ